MYIFLYKNWPENLTYLANWRQNGNIQHLHTPILTILLFLFILSAGKCHCNIKNFLKHRLLSALLSITESVMSSFLCSKILPLVTTDLLFLTFNSTAFLSFQMLKLLENFAWPDIFLHCRCLPHLAWLLCAWNGCVCSRSYFLRSSVWILSS